MWCASRRPMRRRIRRTRRCTASLESDPFLIDNTPPEITVCRGAPSGGKIEVRFHAKDALSDHRESRVFGQRRRLDAWSSR